MNRRNLETILFQFSAPCPTSLRGSQSIQRDSNKCKRWEIAIDEDENRKITAAEALKKLDEVKNFIEINGSDNLKMIFNKLIENVE